MPESLRIAEALKNFIKFNESLPIKFQSEIPNDERVTVSIQGRMSEWLVCTDKQVHIIKSGFSTGRVGQIGNFAIQYRNISNTFTEFHISYGYFEIISAGQLRTKKTYWGSQKSNPQMAPNSIGINKKDVDKFNAACVYINARSAEEKELYLATCPNSEAPIEQSTQAAVDIPSPQESQSVRCPKCGSTNLQVYNEVVGKGVSGTKVCLFGICGLCGAGKTKNVQYWICKSCGYKFKA